MFKKTLAGLLAFGLLGQNAAFASIQTQDEKMSLEQVQAQVKTDLDTFHQKYGQNAEGLIPASLAVAPLLAVSKMSREDLESELLAARKLVLEKNAHLSYLKDYMEFLGEEILPAACETEQSIKILEEKNACQAKEIQQLQAQVKELKARPAAAKASSSHKPKIVAILSKSNLPREPRAVEFFDGKTFDVLKAYDRLANVLLFADEETYQAYLREYASFSFFDAIQHRQSVLLEPQAQQAVKNFRTKYMAHLKKNKLPLGTIDDYTITKLIPVLQLPVQGGKQIGLHILKRAGLLGTVTALLFGTALLANTQEASAQERATARRIIENPELITGDDFLAVGQSSKLVSNTAREVASVLHTALQLSAEDMNIISQLQSNMQREKTLQQQAAKKAIIKSLQTLKAY